MMASISHDTKIFVALLLFVRPASAQTIIAGDTIKLEDTTYRLWASTRRRCTKSAPMVGQRV
jgi:hypothetical protein